MPVWDQIVEIRLGGGDFIKEKSSQIGFLEVNAQGMATSQRGHVTRRMERTNPETVVKA